MVRVPTGESASFPSLQPLLWGAWELVTLVQLTRKRRVFLSCSKTCLAMPGTPASCWLPGLTLG